VGIAICKPGRRRFTIAAVLMLLLAAAHSAGNLSPGPSSPTEEKLLADMAALKIPLGMGMNPSVMDFYYDQAWTVRLAIAALGLTNLVLSAIPETAERVLRGVS
jgi:hypothetical protein